MIKRHMVKNLNSVELKSGRILIHPTDGHFRKPKFYHPHRQAGRHTDRQPDRHSEKPYKVTKPNLLSKLLCQRTSKITSYHSPLFKIKGPTKPIFHSENLCTERDKNNNNINQIQPTERHSLTFSLSLSLFFTLTNTPIT